MDWPTSSERGQPVRCSHCRFARTTVPSASTTRSASGADSTSCSWNASSDPEAPTAGTVPTHPDQREGRVQSGGGPPIPSPAMSNAAQFIFTMRKVGRYYPPDRDVLKDISLSFYPGAKIGVIGANGSGKSSLLRIMAGLDDGFTGEARLTPGFSVGHLPQEPQLDPTKDVRGNVMEGVAEEQSVIDRYNERMAMWAEPD